MWKIVKIGIPAWLGEMSFSSSRLVITPLIAAFGTSVVAAYGIGNQITHFGIMILVGIGLGLSSLIGHTIGSGKLKRAKRTADHAILLGVGIMTVCALVAFVFARDLMALFFEAPETIQHGVVMLRIFASGFPFLGAFLMMEEIHIGVGLNTPTMVMSIIHAWVFQAFPIYLLTQLWDFEVTAIWWTICLSLVISSIMFYFYYRRGRWMTVQV
jgi:Na+-driven multidrug efflux pump